MLEVPDNAEITPYSESVGFPAMHIQTFTTSGQNLTDVNFQMVSEVIYDIFAARLQTDPDPERCQIASTVNVADVKGLTLEEFVAYGAHGVQGATASMEPAVPSEHGQCGNMA